MPDATNRARLGKSGEAHARAWLEGRGYRFVTRNWRCRAGELDLVMTDGDELVFVEVKVRTGERLGRASEAISAAKRRRVLAASEWFVSVHPTYHDMIWRCDIVAVAINPHTGAARVDHFINALFVS